MTNYQLKIQHLTKSYGTLPVWEDLNLTLDSRQIWCIMAPSGAGKTTLFRILLGLETADHGQFRLDPPQSCGFTAVFQEDRLCEEFSALDNVKLAAGRSLSHRQLYQELARLLPEESILRPASTLSGGMKRRVAIARALLAPSCGILMDEPFTGLDEDTRNHVIAYIKEKSAGKLLLVATHQEEDISALGGTLLRL